MRGATLPELLTVMVIVGLLASVTIHPVSHALDKITVDEGAQRYAAMFETARAFAVFYTGVLGSRALVPVLYGRVGIGMSATWRGRLGNRRRGPDRS